MVQCHRTTHSSAKPVCCPKSGLTACRSPEGLAYDPRTGKLWQNDHGPRGGDELNIVEKGKNYGWPLVAHGIDYPGAPIGVMHMDGMVDPIYYWDPVIAPSGRLLHGQFISAMEEQPVRRRVAWRAP